MTGRPATLKQAVDDHDVTRALTPAQLVLLVVGVLVLLRLLRRLRR